jgi:hypothetical protein
MRNDGSWGTIIPLHARSLVVDSHTLLRFNVTQYSWPIILRITSTMPKLIVFNTTNAPTARLNLSFILTYDASAPGPTINATVQIEPVDFTCYNPTELGIVRLNPGDSASATFTCEIPYNPPRSYSYVLMIPEEGLAIPGGFSVDLTDPRASLTTTVQIDVCILRRVTLIRSLSLTTTTTTIGTLEVPIVSIGAEETAELQVLECGG